MYEGLSMTWLQSGRVWIRRDIMEVDFHETTGERIKYENIDVLVNAI